MRMIRRLIALLALAALVVPLASPVAADSTSTDEHHIIAILHPVDGSGVFGFVNLRQRPNDDGTRINVMAFGLTPGDELVSLYYDNHTCTLPGDRLSDPYTANAHGIGRTHGVADDNLDEIDSVSVRRHEENLTLLACGDIHP